MRLARWIAASTLVLLAAPWACPARALPLFARQTGQNCVACHAGGQFPELTPYGRLFKLTGYTTGQRTTPLAAMVVATNTRVANTARSDDPAQDFQKNGETLVATASLFLGGRVTDNIGAFTQFTFDPYATQDAAGTFHGHSSVDNIDLRYADRFASETRDLVLGISANNNPSVSDPWNTAPAWMQYVPVPSPTGSRFVDGAAPYPGYAAGDHLAGLTGYLFWNRAVYAEIGGYRTARGLFRFMSAGLAGGEVTRLQGLNPYWRLALNHEWGPHSLMVGTSGMKARIQDDPLDMTAVRRTRDLVADAQYQYLLDPHTVTAQLVAERSASAGGETTRLLRSKLTYTWQAKYGGSAGFFDATGSAGARGSTLEAFWMPLQYARLGLQYTRYSRFQGAGANYDGAGRNARDNNTVFIYLWGAY